MILSFNPIFEGDRQIICAGRDPDKTDLTAVRSAHAVILPQGCRQSLYRMARENCPHVFPNYDARFSYPGKVKQIMLFRNCDSPHPDSRLFEDVASFANLNDGNSLSKLPPFPFVFKFDWGGEGDFVYLINSVDQLKSYLDRARQYEHSGQKGFLIQQYIPGKNRDLRVVVINGNVITYWRQYSENCFPGNLQKGATIDKDSDPDLQETGKRRVMALCKKTGINLAGFDLIFSMENNNPEPLFLEINYFFGRKG